MKKGSRQLLYIGINYVAYPGSKATNEDSVRFQQEIASRGLEISKVEVGNNKITIIRENPSPLQISAISSPVPGTPLGQLLVVAPHPKTSLELFISEAEAAIDAYTAVWPAPNRQIVSCDGTLRELHETTSEHAFGELWENVLGQSTKSLEIFGKPIRGGGLRFVMISQADDPDPAEIEIKIESYLRDTKKIFIETQYKWIGQLPPGSPYDVRGRIEKLNLYAEKQVSTFLEGGPK